MNRSFSFLIVLIPTLWNVRFGIGQEIENFGSDLDFLKSHQEVIVLSSADSMSQVAIIPAYQGRVMTSTAQGTSGASFGWINYQLIESDEVPQHIMPVGGEVLEANEGIEAAPESVNSDPYGKGWIIKMRITDLSELDSLLSAEEYKEEIGA